MSAAATSEQIVLITGGSRGLGKGSVEALLADGHTVDELPEPTSDSVYDKMRELGD